MNRYMRWFRSRVTNDHSNAGSSPTAVETKQMINPLIALHSNGDATWSGGGYAGLSRDGYLGNPVAHRCVRMIAEAGGSVAWLLYDGRHEMDSHPLLSLLARPNPRQSGPQLIETLIAGLLISGNAWLQKIELEDQPKELHTLRPDRMEVITDDAGWPVACEHQLNGHKTRFDLTSGAPPVLHIPFYHPLDDFSGASPLASAHMAIDIHNAASRWNKALLDNSARPSGALVYATAEAANLTDEQFARLKGELEDGYTGATRAGRPLLLEGGLDWKPMGLSPKDMDFMEARNGAARDIALALGVPPMLLGIPGDNTYANYQEANRAFWRQTVLPLINRISVALENWLGPYWPGELKLDIDRDRIEALAVDRDALWKRVNDAGFLTANEKRAATGFGEIASDETFNSDGLLHASR